ncbi:hypothetical protein MPY17_30675 [Rhodococcus opacus]|uniref:hypothetical protein n=1 Tax=Rhodococcus opacus TaxID=37919 RepID=UPI001FF25477|nr:hypothetical protein [Rhodococcus opacus]UOT03269.1 hypothetical protein MPY17_30675 [Rhodococcus opacus]
MSARQTEYGELLEWAYSGELFGAAVFTYLLGTDTFPEHRGDLELLLDLEVHTRDRLAPLAGERVPDAERQATRTRAAEFALDLRTLDWPRFMTETQSLAQDALPLLERLVELAPPETKPLLTGVVAHERALISFARCALAGDDIGARRAVTDHLASPVI